MAEPFTVLIMAAGLGTRMRSATPKVLHPILGKPMVSWVIDAAREAGATRLVCITRPGDGVAEGLPEGVEVAEQTEGEGTGSAVLAAREILAEGGTVAVLSGDVPLLSADLIAGLRDTHAREGAAATLLTTSELDPTGYGRVIRADDGSVDRIVETKRTEGVSPEELSTREINVGAYAFEGEPLLEALDQVPEIDGERYLPEALPILRAAGQRIAAHETEDTLGAMGINNRVQLMEVEALAQRRIIEEHAHAGVSFLAPETNVVAPGIEIGEDTVIGPGTTIMGETKIGGGCEVGPHTTVLGATLGDNSRAVHSYLVGCELKAGATVGPFAYLRPGAVVGAGAKIGTFVEIKNSDVGAGAKIPHLSYIGDADVGEGANVAAGNITANYDGRNKHRTTIGKRVKTGVHTSLVAPVTVGDDAYTGAGSVITDDVPQGALGISRPEQKNVEGYTERVERKQA